MSKASILYAVKNNQPEAKALPDLDIFTKAAYEDVLEKFCLMATGIGSRVFKVKNFDEIRSVIQSVFSTESRKIASFSELGDIADVSEYLTQKDPHSFEDVELAIFKAHFGVAENSALWITEDLVGHRVLPFICQHLAMVVSSTSLVDNMHDAYDRIADADYGYGAFISGPSKTADIEQSLVLGAHGPRSLTIFLLEEQGNP